MAAAQPFGFALCNEIYGTEPLAEACRSIQATGYQGVELAPHTLAVDGSKLPASERACIRSTIAESGLSFVGLHWLLVSPPGLHVTSPDAATRAKTWDYIHRLIDLCAELATPGASRRPVMVFGSPKQRTTTPGQSRSDAVSIFAAEMERAAPRAEAADVTLLVEAIPAHDTDVINTLGEAVSVVHQVGSPAVQTMFDVHNTADETEDHAVLLRRYREHIRHVHVNEMNGDEPGRGRYDFGRLLDALLEVGYEGWVSVEAFDFTRPSGGIAQLAFETLQPRKHIK